MVSRLVHFRVVPCERVELTPCAHTLPVERLVSIRRRVNVSTRAGPLRARATTGSPQCPVVACTTRVEDVRVSSVARCSPQRDDRHPDRQVSDHHGVAGIVGGQRVAAWGQLVVVAGRAGAGGGALGTQSGYSSRETPNAFSSEASQGNRCLLFQVLPQPRSHLFGVLMTMDGDSVLGCGRYHLVFLARNGQRATALTWKVSTISNFSVHWWLASLG